MARCISAFTSDTPVTYLDTSPYRVTEKILSRSYSVTSGSTVITYVNSALADQIQVRWAASDSVDWPVGPTTFRSPVGPTAVDSMVSSTLKPSPPLPPPPELTSGFPAIPTTPMPPIGPGIYLSVGIPGALIIMAFLFFFVRLRKARKKAAAEFSRRDIEMVDKAELGGEPVLPQESGGIMRIELDAIMGGPGRTAELEVPIAELAAPFPELEGSCAVAAPEVDGPLLTQAPLPLSTNIIADEAGALQSGNL